MSTIDIQGIIGWETDIAALRTQFAAAGDVTVRLHSPGGEVFDGIAIHNLMRDHRRAGHKVTAVVTGLAASMATYIAMAADDLQVEDNAVWMVHNPWTLALGDHREMQQAAETLNGLTGVLAAAYAAKTKQSVKAVRQQMDAETWLYGADIVAAGYADSVLVAAGEPLEADAALATARTTFAAMRHQLKQRGEAQPLDKIAALIQPLKQEFPMPTDNELPDTEQVPEPAPKPAPIPEPTPAPAPAPVDVSAAVQSALAAERARTKAIRDRCNALNMPHLIDALIDSGATAAQVDKKILDEWAASGGNEIRQTTTNTKSGVDVNALQQAIFKQVSGAK